jgi:hypothetical protein
MMPHKEHDAKLAWQREWYARNKKRVIAKVSVRKHTLYAGVCLNCGAPTVGVSKGNTPSYCRKPECRRAQALSKSQAAQEILALLEEHGPMSATGLSMARGVTSRAMRDTLNSLIKAGLVIKVPQILGLAGRRKVKYAKVSK